MIKNTFPEDDVYMRFGAIYLVDSYAKNKYFDKGILLWDACFLHG